MIPLKLSDFTVFVQGAEVISQVTLCLDQGKIYGLLGLNGAGKTTLLKGVCDFMPQTKGQCEIYGSSFQDPTSREYLFFYPENLLMPQHLKGYDYLKSIAKLHGDTYDQESVYRFAQRLEFDQTSLSKRINTYSKGMRQKLGLLSILTSNSKIWLLDEVMCGLDFRVRSHVIDLFKEFATGGGTILFTTHLIEDVRTLCDDCFLLDQKHIKKAGTAELHQLMNRIKAN